MTKYLLVFLLCSFMSVETATAQSTYLGTSPASGAVPTPEEFQNSIRAQQNQNAQSNLNKPQNINIPPADAPPLAPASADAAVTNTPPDETKPIEQAPPVTQSSAPVSPDPIPALPQTPGAQSPAATPSKPQVYTGFQGNSNSNAKTNSKAPANQEKWNIRY